jgi:uncharacterized heparinase superfamily protein
MAGKAPPDKPPAGGPPADPAGTSLRRDRGGRGPSLAARMNGALAAGLYASPLHALRLRGRFPLKLLGTLADPVPGDPALGERLMAGRLIHAGHTVMIRDLAWRAAGRPLAWTQAANSWLWLRDLATVADPAAARGVAEGLVRGWLAAFGTFDAQAWAADITGQRLLMALAHAPLILSSPDQVYRSALLSAIATWARHLDRAAPRTADPMARAAALAGLYAAGILIPGGEARASAALAALDTLLAALVLPDGGIASRAPADALALAQLLLLAGAAPAALGTRAPPLFAQTLARLVPALRGLMLGDGQVGAWHGSAVIAAADLDRLARQVATGNELRPGGDWCGYRRLSAGRSVVVIDAGPPPAPRGASSGVTGHASMLALEMSDGAERLIVNCGGSGGLATPLSQALAVALAATAAHSTLVIADTSSTPILADGQLAGGKEEVTVAQRNAAGGQLVEAGHDGYLRRFGLMVVRRLYLSGDGSELVGEDQLTPGPSGRLWQRRRDQPFDVRFHLGAGVSATPTADGMGALLKTPAGRIWAFKAQFDEPGGQLAIEPSLWVDSAGTVQRTLQLVCQGRTKGLAATLGWSLKRAK